MQQFKHVVLFQGTQETSSAPWQSLYMRDNDVKETIIGAQQVLGRITIQKRRLHLKHFCLTGYGDESPRTIAAGQFLTFLVIQVRAERKLVELGHSDVVFVGHSSGVWFAAMVAGLYKRNDALRIMLERARQTAQIEGLALLVRERNKDTDVSFLQDACQRMGVWVGVVNSPSQVLLFGTKQDMAKAQTILPNLGFQVREFPLGPPWHTVLLRPAAEKLEKIMSSTPHAKKLKLPVAYLEKGKLKKTTNPETILEYMLKELTEPFNFWDIARQIALDAELHEVSVTGKSSILTGFVEQARNAGQKPAAQRGRTALSLQTQTI